MEPFPTFAFHVKLTVSILDTVAIDYKYLDIKKTIYGYKIPTNDSEKIALAIIKTWTLLFLSRQALQEVKFENFFNFFGELLNSNFKNKAIEISEVLKEKNENDIIYFLLGKASQEEDSSVKIILLLYANIYITKYFNEYFVYPRDFLINLEAAFLQNKSNEVLLYLSIKVNYSKYNLMNFDDNIRKFSYKKSLFFDERNIIEMRIFGSILDGTFNSQSDIDMIVKFEKKVSKPMRKKYLIDILELYGRRFKRAVDIHDIIEFDIYNNEAYLSSKIIWKRK